ncbi:MAG: GNAT family N-acetyltransferase [Bdellovibrionales bacterium]|nr:GNAT family N-acetyltransferase [Bdellovibrionales bacterium]
MPVSTLGHADMVDAIFLTAVEGCLSWNVAPFLNFESLGESIWFTSDISNALFNSVVKTDPSLPIFRETVALVRAINPARPFAWLIPDRPAFSAAHHRELENAGFHLSGSTSGMIFEGRGNPVHNSPKSNLSFAQIETSDPQFREWSKVILEAYGFDPKLEPAWTELHQCLGNNSEQFWAHFVASLDGEFVGVCSLFHGTQAGSIANFAIRERFRGKGAGRYLLARTLEWSKSHFPDLLLTLFATPQAVSLYKSLNFIECGKMYLYFSD